MENGGYLPVKNEAQSEDKRCDCICTSQTEVEVHGRSQRSAHPVGCHDNEDVEGEGQSAKDDHDRHQDAIHFSRL